MLTYSILPWWIALTQGRRSGPPAVGATSNWNAKDGQTSVYNWFSFPEQPRTMAPMSHSFPKVLVHACLQCINPFVSLEILLGCCEIYVVYSLTNKNKKTTNSASLEKPDKKNMPKDIRRKYMGETFDRHISVPHLHIPASSAALIWPCTVFLALLHLVLHKKSYSRDPLCQCGGLIRGHE